jgi:hypothetical protein
MIRIPLLLFMACSLAVAFQSPRGSFNLGQLEEAQKQAITAKQPLAFVIVDKNATPT